MSEEGLINFCIEHYSYLAFKDASCEAGGEVLNG